MRIALVASRVFARSPGVIAIAQELSEELRELLLDIRREHPSASVSLILATLTEEGYFEKSKVSEPTVRRLFAAAGLPRRAKRGEGGTKTRLRWQAEDVAEESHRPPSSQTSGYVQPARTALAAAPRG